MGSEREELRAKVWDLVWNIARTPRLHGTDGINTTTDAILSLLSPELGGPKLREVGVHAAVNAYNRAMAEGSPGNIEFLTDQYVAMQVALEAYGEAPELGGWRGIESAPRNAKEILVLCRRNGVLAVVVAHWADGGGEEQPRFRGWFYSTDHGFVGMRSEPTHWMPLPPPPTGAR